jgi:MoxR-like ATPase
MSALETPDAVTRDLALPKDGQARVGRFWRDLRDAVAGSVVGEEPALRLLAVALLADGHALIEDVPGVGKTLLARSFARSLGLSFGRVQGTPDLLPTDVTGSSLLEAGRMRFVAGPVFTNVLLVDEINRATPRTQSALLEAMQERQVSIEGETRRLPTPFFVVATQNPVELEGTFSLPEAQLDRFLVLINLGYPSRDDERRIASRHRDGGDPLSPNRTSRRRLGVLDDRAVHRRRIGSVSARLVRPSRGRSRRLTPQWLEVRDASLESAVVRPGRLCRDHGLRRNWLRHEPPA